VLTRVPSDHSFRCHHDTVVRTSLVGSPEEEELGINLVNCSTTLSFSKKIQLDSKNKETVIRRSPND
jgi:hypothetical protein